MGQLSRTRQFVGRETGLCALAGALKGGAAVAVHQARSAAASGMGGIGKTQLAVEFAYRYGPYFAGVFWLGFAQANTIEAEIARCGGPGHLQLFTEAAGLKLAEQANLVRARWACGLPYLLIFDNCEEPDLVRQVSGDANAQAAVDRVVTAEGQRLTDAPTLAPITAFLPILRGVTDAALLRENATAATLGIWLGRHLDRLGSYAPAQPYVERALTISERVLCAAHPDTVCVKCL